MRSGEVARGWRLARVCLRILISDGTLLAFPVLSCLLSTCVWVLFSIPVALARDWDHLAPMLPVLLFLLYFATYGVVLYCNTALLHCLYSRLTGEPCTLHQGFARAARHLDRILAWAAVGGLVGEMCSRVETKGRLGQWVASLVGGAWAVVTYFAVPVMILENVGPFEAIKRSRDILKRTWGHALQAYYGLGALSGVLVTLAVLCFVGSALVAGYLQSVLPLVVALLLLVPGVLFGMIVLSCLGQVFRTAVYLYCRTSTVPAGFDHELVSSAFRALD